MISYTILDYTICAPATCFEQRDAMARGQGAYTREFTKGGLVKGGLAICAIILLILLNPPF